MIEKTYESFLDFFKSQKRLGRERRERTEFIIQNKLSKTRKKIEDFVNIDFKNLLEKIFPGSQNFMIDMQNRTGQAGDFRLAWMIYIRKDNRGNNRLIWANENNENENENGIWIKIEPLYDKNKKIGFDDEFISLFTYIVETNPDLDYNFFENSPHYTDEQRTRQFFIPMDRLNFLDDFNIEEYKDWKEYKQNIIKYNL
jgi:hypothetical protein